MIVATRCGSHRFVAALVRDLRPLTRYVLLNAAFAFSGPTAASQEGMIIRPPSCVDCKFLVTRVARLARGIFSGEVTSRPYGIARDSRGRFYLVAPESERRPYVFGPTGKFLQMLGREGQGPGEYSRASAILVGAGDTIHVFDEELGRHTVLGPDYAYVRSNPIPVGTTTAALSSTSGVVVSAQVRDPARAGLPFHVFDAKGNYLRSFGDTTLLSYSAFAPDFFWLTSARSGGVWTLPLRHNYSLTKWSENGTKLIEMSGNASWFKPYRQTWEATPTRAPMPRGLSIFEQGDGRVRVLLEIADRRWARGLGKEQTIEGVRVYDQLDHEKIYDAVLEVIEPGTGQLIASQVFDRTFDVLIDDELISSSRVDEDGVYMIDIWRVQLQSRRSQ